MLPLLEITTRVNFELEFMGQHIIETKSWFIRISHVKKRKFLFSLIDDVTSCYALSLVLKSIWNCRSKDVFMGFGEFHMFSSFDEAPRDHDRCIRPVSELKEIMESERQWFNSLSPYCQSIVLLELLSISGGPIMLEVLKKVENIYMTSKKIVAAKIVKSEIVTVRNQDPNPGLRGWTSAISSYRDSLKLEEIELTSKDANKFRFWSVQRPNIEVNDTIDFIQLLPASLAIRILSYLPQESLSRCASVNKYWANIVDNLRSEITVRLKLNIALEKLKETIYNQNIDEASTIHVDNLVTVQRQRDTDKSKFHKFMKKRKIAFNNMKELQGTLDNRGAADNNFISWCEREFKKNTTT